MISFPTTVEALAILRLQEYAKLLKNTSFAVFFNCNQDSITIYSTGDCLYSTINRIIIPNSFGILGTFTLPITQLNDFCKKLIMPSIPVEVSYKYMQIAGSPDTRIQFWDTLERDFYIRLGRLNEQLTSNNNFMANFSEETCELIKNKMLSMKATMPSEMICLNNDYIITIFSGMLPLNKADTLQIRIIDSTEWWYMIEYIVSKKKYPYPISVFYKYRRV